MMIICKRCGSKSYVKNGFVREMQRYRCRDCGYNFTDTPRRGRSEEAKALAVLLYSMGKSSYRFIGKLLGVSQVAVYNWICEAAANIPEPEIDAFTKEMELDELWHFLHSKKTSYGYGKPMIVASKNVLPGLWATVILQPFDVSLNESGNPAVPIIQMTGQVTGK